MGSFLPFFSAFKRERPRVKRIYCTLKLNSGFPKILTVYALYHDFGREGMNPPLLERGDLDLKGLHALMREGEETF
jgi:hypothetical protein